MCTERITKHLIIDDESAMFAVPHTCFLMSLHSLLKQRDQVDISIFFWKILTCKFTEKKISAHHCPKTLVYSYFILMTRQIQLINLILDFHEHGSWPRYHGNTTILIQLSFPQIKANSKRTYLNQFKQYNR